MNTTFDAQFSTLSFYQSHPYMKPFVGDDYISPKFKKLLLIGDSHYMPEGSSIHHNVSNWYNGSPILSKEEEDYCNTRNTWQNSLNPQNKAKFGKNIYGVLKDIRGKNALDSIAFYNYFLRPADNPSTEDDEGNSSYELFWKAHGGSQVDREYAIKNLLNVITILKPDLVVFHSKLVNQCVEGIWSKKGQRNDDYPGDYRTYCANNAEDFWEWTKDENRGNLKDYIYLNHPSTSHWNRPMPDDYKKANGKTARQFFEDWLNDNW